MTMSIKAALTPKHWIALLFVGLLCFAASNSVFLASKARLIRAHISGSTSESLGDGPGSASIAAFLADVASSDVPILKAAAAYIVREEEHANCDLEQAKHNVSWNKSDGRRRDIGICLQIRNDAGILDEYIAFHWLQVSEKLTAFFN
jgi:hypothetical protein